MATVDSIVTGLQSTASSALSTAREQASRIGYQVPNLSTPVLNFTATTPKLPQPPQFGDLFPGTDTSDSQMQWLNQQVDDFVDKYFPNINGALRDQPEAWVCGILSGDKEFGLDQTVFEKVWQRGRDRQYRASATERATLRSDFSERGFSLQPGALLQAEIEAEARAGQAIAEINREQMVQEAQIKLDLMKFAAEQAARLKLGIMDALRAFYVTWSRLPDQDIERARIKAQAQATLYSSLSSYYNVELGFQELRLRAASASAGLALDTDRVKISASQDNRNGALGSAVRGFTDVAAAATNAGSALVADVTSGGGSGA
ncbi:hypothetical protein FEA48_30810 [Pseudomonas nitroreducens]|uniref:Uncharacterized protein n=1 Tax=Pseudomonas nitroreducens TaxID=46680 RepID=A0A5R8ZQ37_PSENT|nr:hypothetical protein [Pseudomonas nitroreducens]TLP68247.1 hypothetical protein FEA48_30810 [Pseudomonas nitroreducens]